MIKNNWGVDEVKELYTLPLFVLLTTASQVHRQFHNPVEIQACTLISVKTGGCPEDCKYCAQSSRYQTDIKAEKMLSLSEVKQRALKAKEQGVSRICLGAAWRKVRDDAAFESILQMVSEIKAMGIEVCCTLGTLNSAQAERLKAAGLYAYNHNIDTSREFYPKIITTRTFDERLNTLETVRQTQLSVCCGGIVGLGESEDDRISFLHTLAAQNPPPDSVPINLLHPVAGTPLETKEPLDFWDFLRTIATARILMPQAIVRLSAGRINLSFEQQALCFLAGANSVFLGEKLLTVPNPSLDRDESMFTLLGLKKRIAYVDDKT